MWSNISHTPNNLRIREWVVISAIAVLLLFWTVPTSALASLLSYKEIKKVWPWLGGVIDASPQVRAIVQNSLPSVAIASINALLPFLLEGTVSSVCLCCGDSSLVRGSPHLPAGLPRSQLDRVLPHEEVSASHITCQ